MEEPGYPGAHKALAATGARLIPVPVDDDGLVVEEGVRRGPNARAAYITPSHQFPMGAAMSAARRLQLLDWAARSGAWIIEDDYDSEHRFGGRPIACLQGIDADARVIYVGTFSKVMFPALRLGYLVAPKDLVSAFAAVRDAQDIFAPVLLQAVLADFLNEGHFARHVGRMRGLYKARCAALAEAIGDECGDRMPIVNAEAGMHLVGLLPLEVDDRLIARQAAAMRLTLVPLSACCLEAPPRRGLVLGYGGADEEALREGVRKLAPLVREALEAGAISGPRSP
jgi:GntR family transcriptional regulator/MocR family aminotransferase